ncbi:MAG: hypothetical protein A2648_01215 [Candidatus Lloydbacteria bacterium RIFCSPHIGHO2_01_FULL_41_20]|uniref:Prepilin-type N-terminal cleavage/methylation domain-containing protein n=1 Tax=Candidatus Lloydbacteria bacterium RIFCSPHIGHO2_01_FULL_41_20 TaxID=1798657 RepID=A0A1G2CUQ7_9BACT|nr:MAG: hypothetical protein A2648_01215 [Candidatus Lloydbacteria bacterium RIFCSPHIGHO2_01_FULL_41_20]
MNKKLKNKIITKHLALNPSLHGFSMIELVVVIGIFSFISAIILGNYNGFNQKMSVSNLAHQIALEIRQAQVYGLSAKESVIGSGVFPGYGIYFSRDIPTSFVLYTDANGDKKYNHTGDGTNCSANSECLESVSVSNGDVIKDICATVSGVTKCASVSQIDFVNVVFTRPDPEATITGTLSGSDVIYDNLQISVETPKKDFFKTVWVWSTGQVSIQ